MAISVLIPAIMKQLPFRLFNSSCVAIHKTILFFFRIYFYVHKYVTDISRIQIHQISPPKLLQALISGRQHESNPGK